MFDLIIVPELVHQYIKYKELFPEQNIQLMPWTCPEFELLDKNLENPYTSDEPRIIYIGIYNDRYLNSMRYLADKGLNIYLGGLYYDGTICRGIKKEEINNKNIHLITNNSIIKFGTCYNYLRYADLALGYYSANFEGGLSSKIVEYLSMGLPIVAEHTIPNRYRILQCNAGSIVPYMNREKLYETIIQELEKNRDKEIIRSRARAIFNPYTICKNILK